MVAMYSGVKVAGYEGYDDPSPKSMRGAAALAANPLPYVARMVTVSADGDITIQREDGSQDVVWCVTGHNPYRFVRLVVDNGGIVKDVHF